MGEWVIEFNILDHLKNQILNQIKEESNHTTNKTLVVWKREEISGSIPVTGKMLLDNFGFSKNFQKYVFLMCISVYSFSFRTGHVDRH